MPLSYIFSPQPSATRAWPLRVFLPAQALFSNFYSYQTTGFKAFSMTTTMPVKPTRQAPIVHSKAPATLPEMPLELILSIIESACTDGSWEEHIPLLMACSLVCKEWSSVAQSLLFTRVTLQSQSSFQLFMNAVDRATPHGRMLGDAVRQMRVVLDHNQPSSLHHHSFALAVTFCPNLTQLDISLYGCAEPGKDIVGEPDVSRLRRLAPSFDDQTVSLLKSGPMITSLHFSNWSENQQSIFQLLNVWPSLQFLSIGGTAPLHPHESVTPFPCELQGLSLKFQTTPSVEFMRWLLHNSTESLRILHSDRDPCVDTLEYLMKTFAYQLESISTPGLLSPEFAAMISRCSQLRRLNTENPSLSGTFYRVLPSTLEHLSFTVDSDTPLNHIIDLITTNDAVRTAKVFLWEGGRKHPLLAPLRIACTYRGIDLTITDDLLFFRAQSTIVSRFFPISFLTTQSNFLFSSNKHVFLSP